MAKRDFKFGVGSVIGLGCGSLEETVWWDVLEVAEDGPGMMIREHGKSHYKSQYTDRSLVTRVRVTAYVDDDGKVSIL